VIDPPQAVYQRRHGYSCPARSPIPSEVTGVQRFIGLVGSVLAAVTAAGLAGCSSGPEKVTAELSAGQATLSDGEILRVNFGPYNAGIGDSWYLTTEPDRAVLTDRGQDVDRECDMPGCDGTLHWEFAAVGPGQTTLVFQYCYRSRPDDCDPGPDRGPAQPVTLSVTVR